MEELVMEQKVGFAYRDKYGILHVVSERKTAEEFASGRVVKYVGDYAGGYPRVFGLDVIDYGNGRVFVGGNEKNGKPLEECDDATRVAVKSVLDKLAELGL